MRSGDSPIEPGSCEDFFDPAGSLISDPTAADSVLDRLVNNDHRIKMRGDSMRRNRGKPNKQRR
jgi:DNA replication protein DnaC